MTCKKFIFSYSIEKIPIDLKSACLGNNNVGIISKLNFNYDHSRQVANYDDHNQLIQYHGSSIGAARSHIRH